MWFSMLACYNSAESVIISGYVKVVNFGRYALGWIDADLSFMDPSTDLPPLSTYSAR